MKEFDFDELDRAVNNLMKNEPGSTPVKADDGVTTVTLPERAVAPEQKADAPSAAATPTLDGDTDALTKTFSPDPAPAAEPENTEVMPADKAEKSEPTAVSQDESSNATVAESASPDVAEASDDSSSPKQSTVPHRKGRFMDVKHNPSSMRSSGVSTPAATLTAPSQRASRQGVSLQPSAPSEPAAQPAPSTTENATDMPVPEDTPPVSETSKSPDPTPVPEKPTAEALDETPTTSEKPTDYSAFLPDAKVEKRPLGQPTPSSSTPSTPSEASTDTDASVEAFDKTEKSSDLGTPASPDTAFSAEYDQHLMAIESGDANETKTVPEGVVEDPAPDTTPAALNDSASVTTPSGPSSIQQQYKEAPSSGDQTNGAIYDTASYHQPLKHPEKKKSGWLWVVLIVIVILAGIGGGAFIYLNGM